MARTVHLALIAALLGVAASASAATEPDAEPAAAPGPPDPDPPKPPDPKKNPLPNDNGCECRAFGAPRSRSALPALFTAVLFGALVTRRARG